MDKIKVLVIPGALCIGGAEKVAANISLYAPREEFEFYYLIFEGTDNVYGPEIEANGGQIICIPEPNKGYFPYMKNLLSIMKQNHYTVVHSHTMFNSGINLLLARWQHVPVRIAHSHTTKSREQVSLPRKLYEMLMRQLVCWNATHCFACGVAAGNYLYGEKTFQQRGRVIFNGIDTIRNAFQPELREKVRSELNLQDKFVIGHTGSLLPVKNQGFLIEMMPEVLKRRPDAVLLLVGEGEESERLQELARDKGVSSQVIFYGPSLKVHELLSAFDVFAFPSLWEGTPLSLLEAQANGLPCIVSTNVPKDVFLTDLITPLPLTERAQWIDGICTAQRTECVNCGQLLDEAGYSASAAYEPIYKAYRGNGL